VNVYLHIHSVHLTFMFIVNKRVKQCL